VESAPQQCSAFLVPLKQPKPDYKSGISLIIDDIGTYRGRTPHSNISHPHPLPGSGYKVVNDYTNSCCLSV
jgi:hypothetical protein